MAFYGREYGYYESMDWEQKRRRFLVRLALLAFVATVVFFGIRGSFSLWSQAPGTQDCPNRSQWMVDPNFLCHNNRQVPNKLLEPFSLFRTLHLDCTATVPGDMTLIRNLCCASTRVVFERLQNPYLELENGTTIKFGDVDMTSVMMQAEQLVCTFMTPCNNDTCF